MAGEPLLPREDVIAYAASKRKSEDAPFTATTTITPSSSSADAKAGGYKQLLEEGEEPPAAARGGVWGAFDAARQWVGDVVGSAYEYVNKRCGIETKIRQARSCARISIRKCVPAPIQKRLPCFGWIDEALKPGPMYDDEPKTLEGASKAARNTHAARSKMRTACFEVGIQKKTDEMRAAFREDAQRRLAKLAGGSLPVKPVTVRWGPLPGGGSRSPLLRPEAHAHRPNQQGSAKAMAERIVSSAEVAGIKCFPSVKYS